jgi:organic radical activating enzyme
MELLDALRLRGFRIAVETNGTKRTDALLAVDHLCVSPKLGSQLAVLEADELKVVVPGVLARDGSSEVWPLLLPDKDSPGGLRSLGRWRDGWSPNDLDRLVELGSWDRLFLAPQDGPDAKRNLEQAIGLVKRDPRWSLSLQTHKLCGLP